MKIIWTSLLVISLLVAVFPAQSVSAATYPCQEQSAKLTCTDINKLLTDSAKRVDIPPEVVKAIALEESEWKQWLDKEQVIPNVSTDGGIGIMQVTVTDNEFTEEQLEKLKTDIQYNIDIGLQILNEKWDLGERGVIPTINDNSRDIIENWYFAVLAYNGTVAENSPTKQIDGSKNEDAYQEKVFDIIDEYNAGLKLEELTFNKDEFRYGEDTDWKIQFKKLHYELSTPLTKSRQIFSAGERAYTGVGTYLRSTPNGGGVMLNDQYDVTILEETIFFDDSIESPGRHWVRYYVQLEDGRKGYVASGALDPIETNDTPSINYSTHVQSYGWMDQVSDGELSGTTGKAKRLEAIKVSIENTPYSGGISYATHVQSHGWLNAVTDHNISGTLGQSKRLEAINLSLTGDLANYYDIYYRVHAQSFGWLDWAKNGESAGTEGLSKRLEAIEIVLVEKGGAAPGATSKPFVTKPSISYSTHVQSYGWMDPVENGAMSGTQGKAKRMEAIKISSENSFYSGDVLYSTHVQGYGWLPNESNGELSGTAGESKRLEAIKISLTGEMSTHYDVYYRVHAQGYGWLDWAKNGMSAGTQGMSKRLEAIEIELVEKGGKSPGSTSRPFVY